MLIVDSHLDIAFNALEWNLRPAAADRGDPGFRSRHGRQGARRQRRLLRRAAPRRDRPLRGHLPQPPGLGGKAIRRRAHPGHRLRQVPRRGRLLPPDGGQGGAAADPRHRRPRRPSAGVGAGQRLDAPRLRALHGGGRRHRQRGPGGGVVGRGPAHRQPLPLRHQRLLPRHPGPRRPDAEGGAHAQGAGAGRHDPRRQPPRGASLLGGLGGLRRAP